MITCPSDRKGGDGNVLIIKSLLSVEHDSLFFCLIKYSLISKRLYAQVLLDSPFFVFMKMRRKFILLLMFYFCEKSIQIDFLASSIAQIVTNFFVDRSENFDFIVFENKTQSLSESVNEVIKISQYPTRVLQISNQQNEIKLNQATILLFETSNSFVYFLNHSTLYHEFSENFNFLVYIDGYLNFELISKLNHPLLSHSSFIYQTRNHHVTLDLYFFQYFRSIKCNKLKMDMINTYKKATMKWETSEFFHANIADLQGCEVIVAFRFPEPLIYETDSKGNYEGYGMTLINEIGKSSNFTCNFKPYYTQPNRRNDDNKNYSDVFIFASSYREVASLRKTHFLYNFYGISSKVYSTYPFTVVDVIFVVSQHAPYTQFEKVFLPFEIEVWYWIVVTITLAVLVIVVLKFCPKDTQNFVFGSRVKTPGLNVL